jgi:hypothetical protein
MAIHVHDSFDDDTWAVFVRNSGDEGFCGRDQVELNSGQPLTFSFLLPRPGATALTTIAADPSDSGGAHGTVFYSDHNAAGTGGFAPTLVPNVGALLTFTLPPPKERQMINGMLHMKWVVAVPPNHLQQETILQETLLSPKAPSTTATRSPQHQLQDLIDGMTSSEATAFMRRVRTASPPSRGRAVPLALSAHAPGIVPHKSIPRLSFAADLRLEQRINAVIAALRAQFGSRVDEILKSPHKTP